MPEHAHKPRRSAARDASAAPVGIAVSRYNATITDALLEGAVAECARRTGAAPVCVLDAPGAFELPALCNAMARSGKVRGVLALGCIIKGETDHDRYIAQAVAEGLVNLTLLTGVPAAFGVLTVNTIEQAKDRSGGALGNKGAEAMGALLDTIDQIDAMTQQLRKRSTSGVKTKARASTLNARPDKVVRAARGRGSGATA